MVGSAPACRDIVVPPNRCSSLWWLLATLVSRHYSRVESSGTEQPGCTGPRVPHELVSNSAFLLARLGMAVKTRAMAAVAKAGYDFYDYSVLAILAEEAREAQATIAATLDIDPGRLVALLDSLEDRGLVVRRRDPRDRR